MLGASALPAIITQTKQDIIDRWRALLFDPTVSAQSAAKVAFQTTNTKRVPWADAEEARLRVETSKDLNFGRILNTFRADFHPWDHDNSHFMKEIDAFVEKVNQAMRNPNPEVKKAVRARMSKAVTKAPVAA